MNFLGYHFFDYKYNIENFSSDLFSIPHIIFIVLSFVLVPLVCILLRKTEHRKVKIFLRIFSILILLLEITKIVWESYYDISTGRGFNKGGILPIYTCSLFIYTMLVAAWGKGKPKDYSLAYIATVSMLSGAIGVIKCNGLNYYPFWTFGAFYSLFFHLSMFAVGLYIIITKYKQLQWADVFKAWVPMLILAIIAIPINYEFGADYMQLHEGSGIPLLSTLAEVLASHNLRFIFVWIMLLVYIPFAAVVVGFVKLWYLIELKIKQKKINKNAQEQKSNS